MGGLKVRVIQGGKNIIDLRGRRASFQSRRHISPSNDRGAMGGPAFRWPAGVYVNDKKFHNIMMAMETTPYLRAMAYRSVPLRELRKKNAELEQELYKHLSVLSATR